MRELLALLGFMAAVGGAALALLMRSPAPAEFPLDDSGAWGICAAGLAALAVACWPRHDDALDGARGPR